MYIITYHALKRFQDHHERAVGILEYGAYRKLLQSLLNESQPCKLHPSTKRGRLYKYDYIQNVRSYYRYARGWTFVLTRSRYNEKDYYVITSTFGLKPKPKIIELKRR